MGADLKWGCIIGLVQLPGCVLCVLNGMISGYKQGNGFHIE